MFQSNNDIKSVFGDTDAIAPAPAGYGSGYIQRPVGAPVFSSAFSGEIYPRKDWDELAAMQEKNKTSPYDVRKGRVAILNQKSTNYCWAYGVVGAIATVYAKTGISDPTLSATSVAAQAKDFQNVGGWGENAVEQIQKTGGLGACCC